jgi:hypothetical protein
MKTKQVRREVYSAQAWLVDQGHNFELYDESRTVLNFSVIPDAVHLKIVRNKLRAALLNTLLFFGSFRFFIENARSFFNRNR